MKLKNSRVFFSAAVVLGQVLSIFGVWLMYTGAEKMHQQTIQFKTFRFDGSSSLVSGKSYYLGGGPQFYLDSGDIVEARVLYPPSDFNGSLSNVYFAVWESAPQPGLMPDQLIQASTLPATHLARSNYLFFQLISDEPFENLAPGSSWTGDFVYSYKVSTNVGLTVTGIVTLACGIGMVALATYRLRTGKSPRARRK